MPTKQTPSTPSADQIRRVTVAVTGDPAVAAAHLLSCADQALARGETPWTLLDATDAILADLRLDLGCEEWECADWTQAAVQDLAVLADTALTLRQRCRALRDALPAARRVG